MLAPSANSVQPVMCLVLYLISSPEKTLFGLFDISMSFEVPGNSMFSHRYPVIHMQSKNT
jgi:hypothetical protein